MDALTERMQETVDGSFADVDVILFVLSARDRIGAGDSTSQSGSSRSTFPS